MDDRLHIKFYRRNLTFLTENVRVHNILGSLYSGELITRRDYEELKRLCERSGDIPASEKLFTEILWRKPDFSSFVKLTQVLIDSGQHEIARVIKQEFKSHPDFACFQDEVQARGPEHYLGPSGAGQGNYMGHSGAGGQGNYMGHSGAGGQGHYMGQSPMVQQFAQSDGRQYADAIGISKADFKLREEDFNLILEMSQYVCQIECPASGGISATGFVLGSIFHTDNQRHFVVLTNLHVYNEIAKYLKRDPEVCSVKAKFQLGQNDQKFEHCVTLMPLKIASNDVLDYALLVLHFDEKLNETFPNTNKLGKFIWNNQEFPRENSVLELIGHPKGKDKTIDRAQVSSRIAITSYFRYNNIRQDLIEDRYGRVFYSCTSFQGSSGSPCFDIKARRLYCMQCGDIKYGADRREQGVLLYNVVRNIIEETINDPLSQQIHQLFPDFS